MHIQAFTRLMMSARRPGPGDVTQVSMKTTGLKLSLLVWSQTDVS